MDGWQVHDIESHGGRVVQMHDGVLERGVTTRHARARKELVPGGEARTLAIDHDGIGPVSPRRVRPVHVGIHQLRQRRLAGRAHGVGL
jgi:hypothetical protein